MYVPAPYAEDRMDVLTGAVRSCSFGSLITTGPAGIDISHIPFVPELGADGACRLLGHLARANPQWHRHEPDQECVASFIVDDAYISPNWYPTKGLTGRMVPTWNYIAVEARGRLEIVEEPGELLALLRVLTDRHEADRPAPWSVDDAPAAYTDAMLKAVVGVRLHIRQMKGAWKLDQKKSATDRNGAIKGLESNSATHRMARHMAEAG